MARLLIDATFIKTLPNTLGFFLVLCSVDIFNMTLEIETAIERRRAANVVARIVPIALEVARHVGG